MIKLIVTSTILSAHASASNLPSEEIARHVARVYDDNRTACLGYFKDSTTFVAPASCFLSNKIKFSRYINPYTLQLGRIYATLQDTQWKDKSYFAFNKAIAITSPTQATATIMKPTHPFNEGVRLEVVDLYEDETLQIYDLTSAGITTCRATFAKENLSATGNLGDLFCATSNASRLNLTIGAPAFVPPQPHTPEYFIGGIHIGKVEADGQAYYFFSKATNVFTEA
ncbi:hypothetical protein DSO57_1015728 [Entomophthora muscae]|uniref:Uncharacterized protein n=1 Tax=Entomophthora muscae TaxID=34485 RepID=A0ACC2RWB8_9FUNG|nr:hypothetical protein DSO57_1015728 [Entomophthora muscae]